MMSLIIKQHDEKLKALLAQQITDSGSPWFGGLPDKDGLFHANAVGGLLRNAAAAIFHPDSGFFQDATLLARMQSAVGFLDQCQTADGNVSLLTTNFNSPPDTGFVVQNVATAAKLAQINDDLG